MSDTAWSRQKMRESEIKWDAATANARNIVALEEKCAALREERDKLKAERADRLNVKWTQDPTFNTFVELKHGIVGEVLKLLQEGQISRGKAAQCLAEIAHGATALRMPDVTTVRAIGEEEIPSEIAAERDRLREALESFDNRLQFLRREQVSASVKDAHGKTVNTFAAVQVPVWQFNQLLEDIGEALSLARGEPSI